MSATLRNHSTAAFLLNSDVRGIVVEYERSGTTYLFKSLDPSIKIGDLVVVPTARADRASAKGFPPGYSPTEAAASADADKKYQPFTVVKVVQVDVDPDYDGNIEYKWIAGKFDPTDYYATLEREKDALLSVKRAEVRRRRNELAENIFEDREAMKQIPFAKVQEPPKFGEGDIGKPRAADAQQSVDPVKPPDWPRHG